MNVHSTCFGSTVWTGLHDDVCPLYELTKTNDKEWASLGNNIHGKAKHSRAHESWSLANGRKTGEILHGYCHRASGMEFDIRLVPLVGFELLDRNLWKEERWTAEVKKLPYCPVLARPPLSTWSELALGKTMHFCKLSLSLNQWQVVTPTNHHASNHILHMLWNSKTKIPAVRD